MFKRTLTALLTLSVLLGCFCGCDNQDIPQGTSPTTTVFTTTPETTDDIVLFDDAQVSGELLNFFYMDAIQQQYNSWKQTFGDSINEYLKYYFSLDATRALNLQIYDQEKGTTWADYFIETAKMDAASSLALYNAATDAGHKLSENAKTEYDGWIENYEMYAQLYSITPDELMAANYGEGTTFAAWKEYLNIVITAQDFAICYADSLTYDANALQQAEAGREAEFSAYSFALYHLTYNKYTDLGTVSKDGNVSFTDEQKKLALEAAKKDAQSLTAATSAEALNALIAGLPCNAGSGNAVCSVKEDTPYSEINTLIRPWLTDPIRKNGECTVIPNESVDEAGQKILNGYYVVLFIGMNDNKQPLANVRHLLALSEKSDADAKKKAEDLFAEWQKNPTEDNFIALVKKHSEDGSAEYGGLFEDLAPNSPYVPEFLDWSLDAKRNKGDCEIIKTQYGYHIMYYVGDDDMTYRDLLISQELEEKDYNHWYSDLVENYAVTFVDESKINSGYILSPAS